MGMKMKMINKAAAHFGNPSFFILFRSYSAHLSITNLIQTRCKSGTLKLDEALGFFHSLIHTRPMPSVSAFNQLIGALSKLNHYFTVVYMFGEMMRCVDFCPDIRTMTVVMNCYCRLNNVDLASSVLAITLKRGLQPDAYNFNTLVHGLRRQSESMDDAVELFRRIVGRGDPYDHIFYATIIVALCKTHKILIEMQEIENIKPSVNYFNPIIDNFCKERHVDKALELFQDMVNQDGQPDVVTYTCLFRGLWKSAQLKKALQFLINKNECGALLDVVTYSNILDALCKEGWTAEALNLLEAMSDNGVMPNTFTWMLIPLMYCSMAFVGKENQWMMRWSCPGE